MAGIGEQVARAREEAVQEYKNNFKDIDDYLNLMKDAVDEYKMAVKKVDPNFDGDYYDNLIFPEPLTPASECPVGFEQLDPIGTLGAATEKETAPTTDPETDAPAEQEQDKATPEQPTIQPASQTTDQAPIPPTSS